MKLTRKKAIELCIELWTWLAKTGKEKDEWPEWGKYGQTEFYCWFCEYDVQRRDRNKKEVMCCSCCPIGYGLNGCIKHTHYIDWATAKTPRSRKKYAKLFLAQIKTLRSK